MRPAILTVYGIRFHRNGTGPAFYEVSFRLEPRDKRIKGRAIVFQAPGYVAVTYETHGVSALKQEALEGELRALIQAHRERQVRLKKVAPFTPA